MMDICIAGHAEIVHNESTCPLCESEKEIEDLKLQIEELESDVAKLEDDLSSYEKEPSS